jgi:lipopolysaccharide/colanic/teichoic acid biosynthesis glycosyltransferase/precorrin-6B methylase 2
MEQRKRAEQQRYNEKARTPEGKTPGLDLELNGSAAIPLAIRAPYVQFERAIRRVTPPGAVLLDIGAGTGLHSLAGAGASRVLVATDIALEALKLAQRRAALAGERLHLVCADAENLPFRPAAFDVVTSAGALYCLDLEKVLVEVQRVLRPAGAWVVVDSFDHNPIYRLNRVIGHLGGRRTRLAVTNIPRTRTLERLSAGFGSVRVSYHGILTFAAPLLRRLAGERRAAEFLDAGDRWLAWLRRYAFKIVVVAAEPRGGSSSPMKVGQEDGGASTHPVARSARTRRKGIVYPLLKRVLDVLLSLAGLMLLSPVLGVIAILVRITSPGPALYRAPRVGRDGMIFSMYKFRTMVVNADRIGGSSTPDDDPRITRIGRLLRRYKLDELPQLLNVLQGTMSLVGPRPQVQWAVDLYTPEQRRLLTLRPGITDYASLRFPNEGEILKGSTQPDHDYMEKVHPEKMRLSLEYLQRRSLQTDLSILGRTVMSAFNANTKP